MPGCVAEPGGVMADVRFVERRVIVAVWAEERRDDPPRSREVVIASVEAELLTQDVQAHVSALGKALPRGRVSESSPLAPPFTADRVQ